MAGGTPVACDLRICVDWWTRTSVPDVRTAPGRRPGELSAADAALGQGLADIATIGLMQERVTREQRGLIEQLKGALNTGSGSSRPGACSPSDMGVKVGEAFRTMRSHAAAAVGGHPGHRRHAGSRADEDRLIQQARVLSGDVVRPPRSRCGSANGLGTVHDSQQDDGVLGRLEG